MELSKQQAQVVVDNAKSKGLDGRKALDALVKRGFSIQGVDMQQVQSSFEQPKPTFGERIKETVQDVGQVFEGVARTSEKRASNILDLEAQEQSGQRSFMGTTLKQTGQTLGAGADAIGEVSKGVIKVFSSQEREDLLKKQIGELGQEVGQLETAQQIGDWYNNLDDTKKEAVDAAGGVLSLASEFMGIGVARRSVTEVAKQASKRLVPVIEEGFKQAKKGATNALDEINQISTLSNKIDDPFENTMKSIDTGRTAENTSDIITNTVGKENLLTVPEKRRLLNIDSELGDKYINVLKQGQQSDTATTLLETATQDTVSAMNKYKSSVDKIGGEIGQIKDKLKALPAPLEDISAIKENFIESMSQEGLSWNGKVFKINKNSPFSKADVKNINSEIVDVLNNIEKSGSMEQLLLAIKSLDNKINYSKVADVSGSLQGASKKIRGQLKALRDKALSPEEAKRFADFSEAQSFMDEFFKSDNKARILIKRVTSENMGDTLRLAKEVERVTGIDILDYANLYKILASTTGATSRERSLLNGIMGGVAESILTVSPVGMARGIVGTAVDSLGKKIANFDKLDEIIKALNTKLPK